MKSAKSPPQVQTKRLFLITLLFLLYVGAPLLHAHNDTLEKNISSLSRIGCSIVDSVIKINGTGSIHSNKAYMDGETTLDELDMNFNVRLDSFGSTGTFLFAIGKHSGIAGTLVEFTGTDSTNIIKVSRLNGLTPTFITQFNIPFNLELGENYHFRVGKKVRSLIIEVFSNDSSDLFYNDSLLFPTPFFGCLWGRPFIGCKSGTISILDYSLTTPLSTSPRVAVWGDSFIEGNSLVNVEDRYASLIMDSIGHQNISIMGKGGEASGTINTRFYRELKWFADSKYALVAIGVNDNNFTTWKNNMLIYLDTLKKMNVIPIIATLSPRSDRLPFIAQVNNWIRTVYNGAYIDVSKAVSPSETTWMTGLGMADSIHPTPAGHLAIYERITMEAPYLFRENDPYTIDYLNEITFESINNYHEYASFSNFSGSSVGTLIPMAVIPGQTVYFRDTTDIPGVNTIFHILAAPQRPAAPTAPIIGGGAFDWTYNPEYVTVSDYEFSADAGATWTTCTSKPVTSPGSSSILVRVKATSNNFKGNSLLIEDIYIGIASSNLPADILVFPNPVVDRLTIANIFEETELTIYSADGKVVKTLLLESESNEINTEELSGGFYIFALRNKSTQINFKVLKK